MLTKDQAHAIASEWRPRFSTEEAFTKAWSRYMEYVPRNEKRNQPDLVQWLTKDLEADGVAAVGYVVEPALPVRQDFELGDCPQCNGLRYLRRDLPVEDPAFGRAIPCPECNAA